MGKIIGVATLRNVVETDGDANGTTVTLRLPAITDDDDTIEAAARRPTVLFS